MMTSIEKHADYATSNNQKAKSFQIAVCESVKNGKPFYLSQGFTKKDIEELFNKACKLHAQDKYKEAKRLYQTMSAYDHSDKRGWLGDAACSEIIGNYKESVQAALNAGILNANNPKERDSCFKMLANIIFDAPKKNPRNPQVMEAAELMKAAIKNVLLLGSEYKRCAEELKQKIQQEAKDV